MKPQISLIFRQPLPQYHSIEELFRTLRLQLKDELDIDVFTVPNSGASLRSILKNLRSLKIDRNKTYHVTGDVNYMCLVLGKKSVLTIHDVNSALKGNWIKKTLKSYIWFKWPAKKVGLITVISDFTKNELTAVIPEYAHKIRVIPNPINSLITSDLNWVFNADVPNILLVGTKSNKNLDRTLIALKGLRVELTIIGKLNQNQLDLLKDLKFDYSNYTCLSFEEIVEHYRKTDLLCFASLYEGFGMPIIEAQQTGRPVVTSNIGAMKEVAAESACLVNPYDVNDIRKGVTRVIEDSHFRELLVEKGIKNVERFKLNRIARDYINLYDELDS